MSVAGDEQAPRRTIDEYSVATVPIELRFDQTALSTGTAFIWEHAGRFFLITNWHNVSGINPNTGNHISPTAAEPNFVRALLNVRGALGQKREATFRLRDDDGNPLWWVHPVHRHEIDVVALPIEPPDFAEMYPINRMQSTPLRLQIGMDVFVLGYPYGLGAGALPVWKRGSLASEPQLPPDHGPMLLDTASRPGMSGAPAIRRSWGTHFLENGDVTMGAATATRFIGVYSGRLASRDPLDAQLGLCWPARLVDQIVEGQVVNRP